MPPSARLLLGAKATRAQARQRACSASPCRRADSFRPRNPNGVPHGALLHGAGEQMSGPGGHPESERLMPPSARLLLGAKATRAFGLRRRNRREAVPNGDSLPLLLSRYSRRPRYRSKQAKISCRRGRARNGTLDRLSHRAESPSRSITASSASTTWRRVRLPSSRWRWA